MSDLERHLRAYRRAQSRHRRRTERYTQEGRRSHLNLSDHERRMLKEAFLLEMALLETIAPDEGTFGAANGDEE